MFFNVPYISDETYIDVLKQLGNKLFSVYFSLNQPVLADARIRLHTRDVDALIQGLRQLPAARKYLLANGRFQPTELYGTTGALRQLVVLLEQLAAEADLSGIIFSDGYLLRAVSDAAPDLAGRLQAVPSINFMIDSAPKLASVLDLIRQSRFRPPDKVTLDRSLNRRSGALQDLVAVVRTRYAGLQIELLANEGCLNHCAYRATHEALIASANTGMSLDTFKLNRDLGCVRMLSEQPHRILSSPFIRPEDVMRYADVADIIKISGRTLGGDFLRRAVRAYAAGHYDGNLFDLLDAAHWMRTHWQLPNRDLPADFSARLAACDQNCSACDTCRTLFGRYARALPVHFEPFGQAR